ncbi:MAG TPA: hypothetical protein VFM51_09660 [Solirubrobacterales bacterium]|nr:hypothetical protein [Solirubrobacterales bacterium]
MTEATQPRMARGTKLPAAVLVAALFALLAFAPFASAAADPVASGSATVTLKQGFFKTLKKHGVKIKKIGAAKVKGKKATFPVNGGEMDPLTGAGTLNLGGGLKFKAGKKAASVKALVINTKKKGLFAKVAGKKMKLANLAGYTYSRDGFGLDLTIKKLKLTNSAAKKLNNKLGFKKGSKPFKGNRLMASAKAEEQPSTVTLVPTGATLLALSKAALEKLENVGPEIGGEHPFEVKLSLIPPATVSGISGEGTPIASFPITGGNIGPTAQAGVVQHSGGIKLVQNLESVGKGETTLEMTNIWLDLGTKTASVEVTITNPKTPEANLGPLGRVSIADIQLTGVSSDSVNRSVSVSGTATLQAVTASTLNAVFVEPIEGEGKGTFAAGDPLGSFSFTAQTQ